MNQRRNGSCRLKTERAGSLVDLLLRIVTSRPACRVCFVQRLAKQCWKRVKKMSEKGPNLVLLLSCKVSGHGHLSCCVPYHMMP